MTIDISKYLEKEYEVNCGEQVIKLRPYKAWILKPSHAKKGIIVAIFRCPDGKTVRKAVGVVEQ